jgi:sigma-B regulation protein RsbU (phosphoserine phosphatase)
MIKLIGTDGERYYSWVIEPGTHVLGRLDENEFAVPDKTVSRRHAEIELAGSGRECYIRDLGSHNGTTVNGELISDRTRVKVGDRVGFGRTEFKIADEFTDDVESPPPATRLMGDDSPEKSVFLSLAEMRRPLPPKVTDLPELVPTLMDMARMLMLPEPRATMLEQSLALLAKVVPAERLAILSVDQDSGAATPSATILPQGKNLGDFRLSRTIIKEIMANKTSILIGDPAGDPRFARQESIILAEIRSAMAVPLLDEEDVLGILYVDTTNPVHQYNNDYVHLLSTFGSIIASRLVNYNLLNERQQRQIMQRELTRAARIQRGLLPREVPTVSGYGIAGYQDQSRDVGGDLYDYAALPDGELLFLVADVSGKGMGAALLMSNLLAAFRMLYSESQIDLRRVVRQVSAQMHRFTASDMFATLFVAILNPETNTVEYINAGHNPPMLIRADASIVELDPGGVMIGAFPSMEWEQKRVTMEPGDVLVAFTDGVTEATRGDETQYGEERLRKLLLENRDMEPSDLCARIKQDINTFVEEAPQSDDITTLILKREG